MKRQAGATEAPAGQTTQRHMALVELPGAEAIAAGSVLRRLARIELMIPSQTGAQPHRNLVLVELSRSPQQTVTCERIPVTLPVSLQQPWQLGPNPRLALIAFSGALPFRWRLVTKRLALAEQTPATASQHASVPNPAVSAQPTRHALVLHDLPSALTLGRRAVTTRLTPLPGAIKQSVLALVGRSRRQTPSLPAHELSSRWKVAGKSVAIATASIALALLWLSRPEQASTHKESVTSASHGAPMQIAQAQLLHDTAEVDARAASPSKAAKPTQPPSLPRAPSAPPTAVLAACGPQCQSILDLIRQPFEVAEDAHQRALSNKADLARYIEHRHDAQNELIDRAAHTTAKKRDVILATFSLLDGEAQRRLGKTLIHFGRTEQRLEGLQLLANADTMDTSLRDTFAEVLITDENAMVRSAAVRALNKPELFFGDRQVMDTLTLVVDSDDSEDVRGEALLASVHLSPTPDDLLERSVSAIRNGESSYQLFGVRALEGVLQRSASASSELGLQTDFAVKQLMADLMTPEFEGMPDYVREAMDDVYSRYF